MNGVIKLDCHIKSNNLRHNDEYKGAIPAKAGNPVNRIRYLSKFRDHFTLLAIRAWCDALPPLRRLEKSHRTRRGNPVGSVNPILG